MLKSDLNIRFFLISSIILLIGINLEYSSQLIFGHVVGGLETIQKGIILFLTLVLIHQSKILNLFRNVLFRSQLILLLLSFIFTTVSFRPSITAFLGFNLGLLIFYLNTDKKYLIALLKLLPIITIFLRFVLVSFNINDLFRNEFGIYRLQGLLSPAHLAFLTFNLIFFISYELFKKFSVRNLLYLIIYFVIVFLTNSRMALLLSSVLLFYALIIIVFDKRISIHFRYLILFFLVFGSSIVIFKVYNSLWERTFSHSDVQAGINTSGRAEIWLYYLSKIDNYNWFGLGTGSVKGIDTSSLTNPVKNVHNEYIRVYVENGIVGVAIFFIGLIIHFKQVGKRLQENLQLKKLFYLYAFLILVYSFTDNYFSTISSWYSYCIIVSVIYAKHPFIKKTYAINNNSQLQQKRGHTLYP